MEKKVRHKYDKTLPKKYNQYLSSSRSKKVPFEMTLELFNTLISSNCTYCGMENCNGIDRITPKLGYVEGNMTPCCQKCNTMKFVYPTQDFLNHIEKIYKFNYV